MEKERTNTDGAISSKELWKGRTSAESGDVPFLRKARG